MATFKPIQTTSNEINSIPYEEGQFIATTDTNNIYIDLAGARKLFSGSSGSGSTNGGTVDEDALSAILNDFDQTLAAILEQNTIHIESYNDLEQILEQVNDIMDEEETDNE